jgi:hypothetical protein
VNYDDLLALLGALHRDRVEYVLVGGVALNLHGIVRATEDVDFFVNPTDTNIALLRKALRSIWPDDEIDGITAEDLRGPYPTIRYGPPDTNYAIDILARLGTAVSFSDLEWESRVIECVPVRLATPETLHRMKRNTLRPIDRADAAALANKFDLED